MAAHRSALEAVRQHTNDANILELEAAIEKIPHELLRPSPWHVCLENIIRRFKDAEQDRLLALFVGHGGQVNHVGRRLLLDNEIKTVGKFEVEPDEFDDTGEIAYKIAKKVLEIFPDSAWSQAKDTDRTVFHVAAETGACGIIELATRVIKENNRVVSTVIRQGEKNAQTALELAVEKERTAVVEKLLSLDQDQLTCHPNAERIITTAIDRGPISIVRALLHARPLLVTDGMFRKAIASGSIDILRFLTSLRLDLLQNSTFLHFAVKKGQVDIVEELIEQCPQLVEKYELEISTKIDRSVLYYNHSPKFKEEIRKIVVPVIIQRNAVSIIRELLADSSGREICLDLSAFTHDPTGLQQFLKLVKSQLSKREESSGDVIDEFLKTLTQSDRERFETFYKAFRANETMSALTNGLDGKRLGQTSRENSDLVNLPSLQSSQILQDNHIPPTTKQPSIAADALPLLDVEFEPTLKYVDLPCFDGIEASRREEVKVILDWLRESKNVGKIFHLVVTDSLHNPHSEETIEESVKYFDVEILDWRRIDLSIRTIRDAAPNVKRLHLYSSGNWAALDHWIGPDGVCTLQLLEYVRITIIEDHITRNRAKIYKERVISELTARCARKDDKWFHVVYDTWNPKQSRGMREALKIEQLKPTTITQLDYFLPKYQEIQEQISQNVDPASPGRVRGARIRVAILDSGVDPVLFSSQGRNIVGASFVHKSNGSKESPWWLASDPHGSHIANLVSQLDPCCDLYIAKVAESKNQLQLDQVVQAIEWAVAQRVDIINLSLVLFKYDAYLTNAINNARKEGIIIFCSTADNGNVVQDVWPAKYAKSHDCIFSVAACNAHGRLTEYSSETDAQYTFQGEDILASHGSGATGETERRVSGSSVATAIATGVASLVLACYRIMLSAPPHVVIRSLPTSHAAIIKNVFANMCNDHGATAERKTPLRVMPWLVFPTKASVVGARDWQKQDYTLGEPEDVMHWIIEKFQHTLSES